MRIAMLAPIAWRTPPRHYGPWERVTSLLTEALVERGIDVTLFATAESRTEGRLRAIAPRGYEEDREINPKAWECMHIAEVFEHAGEFDIIHNQFDFLPLTYSRLVSTPIVTTIHGFSSPTIHPVYRRYNGHVAYVAISDADRIPELDYVATVHHGIEVERFTYRAVPHDYLVFFGRMHPHKGAHAAIEIARRCGRRLLMAGIVQDAEYFEREVVPHVDGDRVQYLGSVGPEQRDEILGGAVALLHPIEFEEPFGLSVVESMACGTPVIAFPRGSMPEIITDGVDGFLVADIDGAVAAVGQLAAIDRAAARRTVEERFSVDRMAEEYIEVYRRVISGEHKRQSHAADRRALQG